MIKLIISILFFIPTFAYAEEMMSRISVAQIERSFDLKRGVDQQCLSFKSEPCKPPLVGVIISYWAPEFLMESVKSPGEYVLDDGVSASRQKELLEAARKGIKEISQINDKDSQDKEITPTSMSSYQSMNGANLQFNEVHITPFKPGVLADLACPISLPNVYPFYSEKNTKSWRTGEGEDVGSKLLGDLGMGAWGRIFPRIGFIVHSSPMTASAATCAKGVARMHPEFIGNLGASIDKFQLIYPRKSRCMQVGENLKNMESDFYSKNGRYGWVYWHFRRCDYCVPA